MQNNLITFAIHTTPKAQILKHLLEENGIEVLLETIEENNNPSTGIIVRIKDSDLNKALQIVEENKPFDYSDQQISKIDDGRKRILVAVDFSDYSLNACRVAFNIAKDLNAKVKILHVFYKIYYPSPFPFADQLKDKDDVGLLDKVRKQMLDLCCDIDSRIMKKEFPSINYSYSIREGIVEDEISEFIEEYDPTLVVIGTKGKHQNKASMLGNVTADIIEMNNVPVLAVPQDSPFDNVSTIKHIAFFSNYRKSDFPSFNTMVSILKPFHDVRISLVHVNSGAKEKEKWAESELIVMRDYYTGLYPNLKFDYKLIDTPDALNGVSEFLAKENVQIVALNTRKRNILGRIFIPSVSRKILSNLNIALLVLRG
ncbi:universal stress protein [Dysgonomonas sp. ZJ709]|uniref:universal stress protein n=1 Tax=Dysgonomonas sp. ZJ709 TaxID=2709797 RepID=UPI0013EC1997|nr:universal stress protein [Dysgonomonas sp. ZJ709]